MESCEKIAYLAIAALVFLGSLGFIAEYYVEHRKLDMVQGCIETLNKFESY